MFLIRALVTLVTIYDLARRLVAFARRAIAGLAPPREECRCPLLTT
jgi:hypothetical protein